jgi:hypothetical protein
MPPPKQQPRLDYELHLDPALFGRDANAWLLVPPIQLQTDLMAALRVKATSPGEYFTLKTGDDISAQVLLGVVNFLAGYAVNRPVDLLEGRSLSTDHVNGALKVFGLKSSIPSGISFIYNSDTQMLGIRVKKSFFFSVSMKEP